MIAAEDTALILLAAGRSERFGTADKLTMEYLGRPIGLHVVVALEAVPFAKRIAVVSNTRLDLEGCGYRMLMNDRPETGMAHSLCMGVAAARASGAAAVLIALADMPRVTATHVYRLLDYADGPDAVIASSDGVQPRPPALFGRNRFDALLAQTGDQGARDLIRAGHHVVTSSRELIDIDTPEDFEALTGA